MGWIFLKVFELFKCMKGLGVEVIKKKGGVGFVVGIVICDVIDVIVFD